MDRHGAAKSRGITDEDGTAGLETDLPDSGDGVPEHP